MLKIKKVNRLESSFPTSTISVKPLPVCGTKSRRVILNYIILISKIFIENFGFAHKVEFSTDFMCNLKRFVFKNGFVCKAKFVLVLWLFNRKTAVFFDCFVNALHQFDSLRQSRNDFCQKKLAVEMSLFNISTANLFIVSL